MTNFEDFLDSKELARYRIAQREEAKLRARAWKRAYHSLRKIHAATVNNLCKSRKMIDEALSPSDFSDEFDALFEELEVK